MPRPRPLVPLFGGVDFNRFAFFDADPASAPLGVNDLILMRRAGGGPNLLVTVGDIQAHGGAVDIADLTGGTDLEMLVRFGGVWTSTPAVKFDTAELSIDGHITTRTAGAGEIRQTNAALGPTLVPQNNRIRSGFGGDSGSENVLLFLDLDRVCRWFHTGAAGNDVQWSWLILATKTASTTQTQGNGAINGNRYTDVNVVANDDDVITLPVAALGKSLEIFNTGANRLQIFPAAGDQILPSAVDVSITLESGGSITLHGLSTTEWQIVSKTGDTTTAFPEYLFRSSDFDNPNNADWDINALAPAAADSNNAALTVRLFDDTVMEAVGLYFKLPTGATSFTLEFLSRAETAPGIARQVKPAIEIRDVPDNAAVTSPPWTSLNLTSIDIPTNEFFQYDSQAITFASLALTAGEYVQMQFARNPAHPDDDLPGDWALLSVKVSFT